METQPTTAATEASQIIKTEPVAGTKRVGSPATLVPPPAKRVCDGDSIAGYDDNDEKAQSDLTVDQPCYAAAEQRLAEIGELIDKV